MGYSPRAAARVILVGVSVIGLSFPALADKVAIIGTGNVARALGPEFAAQGHQIVYGSRDPGRDDVRELVSATGSGASATSPRDSVDGADIVVLAVPGGIAVDIAAGLGDLTGKIVIDPTNNVARNADGLPMLGADPSNAELIQAAAPGAHVVKAFNTLNWRTMVDPESSGGPVTIPLVGDDPAAKAKVAALVAGMGLEPLDLGPLAYAKHVEGMLIVWIYARSNDRAFDYHLRRY